MTRRQIPPAAANDRKNSRAYHGGDLRGIINHLGLFQGSGRDVSVADAVVRQLEWSKYRDKPWCPNTYYHGYHAYRLLRS